MRGYPLFRVPTVVGTGSQEAESFFRFTFLVQLFFLFAPIPFCCRVHQLGFLFTPPECYAPVRSSSPRSPALGTCSREQVHRALRRSVFPVRFSVIILIQSEQAPAGFCSFLRLGSQSAQSDCFPSPIHSSKVTPLFAVDCQALVLICTEPFPNYVLANFSVRSGEPMCRPGARALRLGLHDRLLVQIPLLCLCSVFGREFLL
jgi:hypothetical protein